MAFQFGFGDDDDEVDTKAESDAATNASHAVAEHSLQELVGLTFSSSRWAEGALLSSPRSSS